MSVLTWRNVDAPDFSSATTANRDAAFLLNQAFKTANDGLGQFKKQRAEGADQAALAESLKFTDPAAYQEALRSGAIQLQNMSSKGTAALGARVGDLISQANNKLILDQAPEIFAQNTQANTDISNMRQQALANNEYTQSRKAADDERKDTLRVDTEAADVAYGEISKLATDGISASERFKEFSGKLTPQALKLLQGKLEGRYNVAFDGPNRVMEDVPVTADGEAIFPVGGNSASGGDVPYSTGLGAQFHKAQFGAESRHQQFDPKTGKTITSSAGAQGYGQIMPATGPDAARIAGVPYDADRLANDKEYNKLLSVAYSNEMFKRYDSDPVLALSAYNAGMGNVDKAIAKAGDPRKTGDYDSFFAALPKREETEPYVKKIIANSPPAPAAQNAPAPVDPAAELIAAVQPQAQAQAPAAQPAQVTQQEAQPPGNDQNIIEDTRDSLLPEGSFRRSLYDRTALPRNTMAYAGNLLADTIGNAGNFLLDAEPTPDTYSDASKAELIKSFKSATDFESTKEGIRNFLGLEKRAPELLEAAAAKSSEAGVVPTGSQPEAPIRVSDSAEAVAAKALDQQDSLMRDRVISGAAQDYIENVDSKASVPEVADALIAKEFLGADRPAMINQINHLVAETGVNPAIAGAMMRRTQEGSGFWSTFNAVMPNATTNSNNLGGGNRIDDTRMATLIEAMRTRASMGQAFDQGTQQKATTTLKQAKENLIAATKNLSQVRSLAAKGETDAQEVARYEQRQRQAQAMLNSITGKQ